MTDRLTGLLCYENSTRPWQDRVREAAGLYRLRHWYEADVCHVHPATIGTTIHLDDHHLATIDGVDVIIKTDMLPNHFFVARRASNLPAQPAPDPPDAEQLQLL